MVRTKTRGRGSSTFDRLLDLASFETEGPLLGAVHQPEADRVHFSAPSIGHSPVATRPSDESPNSSFKKGSPVPRAASSEFFDVEAEGTAPSGWSDSVRGAALLDEQALVPSQVKQCCEAILGCGALPEPEADLAAFRAAVKESLGGVTPVFDPVTKAMRPWVDPERLCKKKKDGCCIM